MITDSYSWAPESVVEADLLDVGLAAVWASSIGPRRGAAGCGGWAHSAGRQRTRRGPVVIGLPEDVLTHLTAAEAVTPREFAQPAPTDSQLASLASLLNRAERPLVVVGGDGWDGPTGRTLATWASAAGIPIAADFRAYDAVPHDSDSYVGSLGYGRSDALAATLDDADLLLFVGCVRGDVLSDGHTLGMRATTVLVNADVDAHAHAGPIDLQLVSTIAEFVGVLPSVTPHDPDTWLRPARSAHLDFVTPVPHPDAGVDLYEAMSELAKQIDDDVVVVTYGAGNHAIWAGRYLAHTSPTPSSPRETGPWASAYPPRSPQRSCSPAGGYSPSPATVAS